MTRNEIAEAVKLLWTLYRQAIFSTGAWKCSYWRLRQRSVEYPAPWYVNEAECMAEKYLQARGVLLAILAS